MFYRETFRPLIRVIIPATLLLCSVPAWAESRVALVMQ